MPAKTVENTIAKNVSEQAKANPKNLLDKASVRRAFRGKGQVPFTLGFVEPPTHMSTIGERTFKYDMKQQTERAKKDDDGETIATFPRTMTAEVSQVKPLVYDQVFDQMDKD